MAWRRIYRFEAGRLSVVPGAAGRTILLLAQEIAKVGNSVLRIANKLGFGLAAMKLLSFNIGQGGWDLAVLNCQHPSLSYARGQAAHLRLRWR